MGQTIPTSFPPIHRVAEKLGHPSRAASLCTLFSNFLFGSFTSKQLAFTSGHRSMKRHRINTPRAAPFPSRSSGWGILITCGLKCSCAVFTRKSNAARNVLFVQETHPEVFQKLSHFRVPGQCQRSTPAARATGLTYVCLRGRICDALSASWGRFFNPLRATFLLTSPSSSVLPSPSKWTVRSFTSTSLSLSLSLLFSLLLPEN